MKTTLIHAAAIFAIVCVYGIVGTSDMHAEQAHALYTEEIMAQVKEEALQREREAQWQPLIEAANYMTFPIAGR